MCMHRHMYALFVHYVLIYTLNPPPCTHLQWFWLHQAEGRCGSRRGHGQRAHHRRQTRGREARAAQGQGTGTGKVCVVYMCMCTFSYKCVKCVFECVCIWWYVYQTHSISICNSLPCYTHLASIYRSDPRAARSSWAGCPPR